MQPQAIILAIGDELVLGAVQDSNSRFAAQMLTGLGVRVVGVSVVRDDVREIVRALKKSLIDAEIVVVGGGLGPTADDRTRDAVAETCGVELEERAELLAALEGKFAAMGKAMPAANRQQARLPVGAEAIENPLGTAPGILVHRGSRLITALPGVPTEFCNMLEGAVLGAVQEKFAEDLAPQSVRTLLVTGVPEAALDERLRELMEASVNPRLGVSARRGAITVRLLAHDEVDRGADLVLDEMEATLREVLGPDVCEGYPPTAADAVASRSPTARVAVADAVTGGLLAARLAAAQVEVLSHAGDVSFLRDLLPALTGEAGAVEAAAAVATRCDAEAGVAVWPGEAGFLFVAASLGETAFERVVVPTEDREANHRRCVGVALDLLRRLGEGKPAPLETGELEALAAIADEVSEVAAGEPTPDA